MNKSITATYTYNKPVSEQVLSIIMPVYNEEKTVVTVLERIRSTELVHRTKKEVIVVDDCSSDKTGHVIKSYKLANPDLNIKYFEHQKNKGKGAALHTGIQQATGDLLTIQDADLEYDPNDFNKLLEPVVTGQADVVYGSRFHGGNEPGVFGSWHAFGNKFLTRLSNLFTGLRLTDMETCYKLFPTKLIKKMTLKEQRFGFEPEITARIAKISGIRVQEVGISYVARKYVDGKKIGWRDGLRAIYVIFKYGLFIRKDNQLKADHPNA